MKIKFYELTKGRWILKNLYALNIYQNKAGQTKLQSVNYSVHGWILIMPILSSHFFRYLFHNKWLIARYIVLHVPTFVRPKVWIKQRTLPAYIICCSGWHPTERRMSFNSITNWDQYHVWCSKITWSMCIYNIQWMSILLNKILSWQTSQFLILTKIFVSLIVIWVTHFWVFSILCITVIILIDA